MANLQKNDKNIIWNPTQSKGIEIEIIHLNSNDIIHKIVSQSVISNNNNNNSYASKNKIAIRAIYYMVQSKNKLRGRLIGTCLPDITFWNETKDITKINKLASNLITWVNTDYFIVCSAINPLVNLNTKYELYYWPVVDEYPSLILQIPAITKSNGNLTLFFEPKSCKIDTNYIGFAPSIFSSNTYGELYDNILKNNNNTNALICGYNDLKHSKNSSLGSRRFQWQIIPFNHC